MAITDFEARLNAYFDRELDARDRAAFMEELRTNAQYRWDFKIYRKLFQVMEQMEVDSPEDLPQRIKDEVRRLRVGGLRPRHALASPATFALAAAALFFFALFMGRETRPPAGPLTAPPAATRMALAPAQPPPAPPAAAGTIRVIPEGRVEVMRKGSITWTLVHAGERIDYEDKVRTGGSGTVRLVYPDRAFLKVKPDSLVQVLDEAVRIYQGDAWIKVEKKGSRFEARTPNAVASVRGTMYSVHVRRLQLDRDEILRLASDGTTLGVTENVPAVTSDAAVSAAGTHLSLARHLWQHLLGAFETDVQVFESTVAVSALDPDTGAPVGEQLVAAGQGTHVAGVQVAAVRPLQPEDYQAWKLPVPPEVLAQARPSLPQAQFQTPAGTASVGGQPVDDVGARPLDGVGETSEVPGGPSASSTGRPEPGILGYQGLTSH